MINIILVVLGWSFSIGNKFFKVVPGMTMSIVFFSLVSQVSILLAFLLPLKVLMLLGSEKIPQYFPSFLAGFDRDVIVFSLSFSAILFYALYLVAEKGVSSLSSRGAMLLLQRSQKVSLFENQEDIADKAYQRYSRSLAAMVFIVLVAIILLFLYPFLLFFLLLYAGSVFLFFSLLYASGGFLKRELDKDLIKLVGVATNLGFLSSFAVMVVDLLYGAAPAILVAIISIILVRQGFSRFLGLVNDIKGLYSQKLRLNALFFHGHVLINEANKSENNFWLLMKPSVREDWVRKVLENHTSSLIKHVDVSWCQLVGVDVAAFHVRSYTEAEEYGEFLIKIFNSNKTSLAKHEETVLLNNKCTPALPLVCVDKVQGLHCHIFDWQSASKLPQEDIKSANLKALEKLLSVDPGDEIISQFKRSKPLLWKRVNESMMQRLEIVAGMVEAANLLQVKLLKENLSNMHGRLSLLPLVLVNPDQGPDAFVLSGDKKLLMLNWGRWSIEPVGANWPTHPNQIKLLPDALNRASQLRDSLRVINIEDVQLAAFVFAMEKAYVRQDFMTAISFVPRILKCLGLEDHQPSTSVS